MYSVRNFGTHDNRAEINLDINVNNSKRLVININAVDNNIIKRDQIKLPVKCTAAAGKKLNRVSI